MRYSVVVFSKRPDSGLVRDAGCRIVIKPPDLISKPLDSLTSSPRKSAEASRFPMGKE